MKVFGFIPVSVWDLVDVFLMTLLIYIVLRVLSGTKMVIILMSIAILFLIEFLGKALQLPSISLVVSALRTFGVVILIIIFQPEIRRLLMEIGSNPLVRFFIPEERVPIDEIIAAIEEILRRRLGALIIIERRLSLRDFAEDTGIILEAKLSAPVLISIFDKNSPLHDGAVIIKNDTIVAASVMVPMSVRYRSTGARKGTITLFNRGKAHYNLSLENLKHLLEKSLRYENI